MLHAYGMLRINSRCFCKDSYISSKSVVSLTIFTGLNSVIIKLLSSRIKQVLQAFKGHTYT